VQLWPFEPLITGKNQFALPAAIVSVLKLEPGTRLEFEVGDERTLIVRPGVRFPAGG